MTITRPPTVYDDPSHTYTLDGEELLSVSGVAKIGGAESTWGIASAWGFRIGYEGALTVLEGERKSFLSQRDRGWWWPSSADELRGALKDRGLTPWSVRDKAGDRGTWVHDILEQLAQEGESPTLAGFSEEYVGHARAVLAWYLDYRPEFVATEVQVTSTEHGFSGRYDIRCRITQQSLAHWGHTDVPQGGSLISLCLVDLKTSKGVYPLTHYPQLSGYELASVEMGFPATDAQFVLNTHPDGTYDFKQSWATGEDFLAYLGALKAIRRIEAEDPAVKLRVKREGAILANLPGRSAEMARSLPELAGLDGRSVGFLMGGLRKRGLVEQGAAGVWDLVVPSS